jgi:hypothetical protein
MLPTAHFKDGGVRIASFRSWIPTSPSPCLRFTESLAVSAQDSGPSRSLVFTRKALSSSASCRFIPAHCNGDVSPLEADFLTGWQLDNFRVADQLPGGFLRPRFQASTLASLALARRPWSYPWVWRVSRKAASDALVGKVSTHTMRRSYRSWLDAVGTSIAVQQKLMRHTDIRTTMNVYGDVVTNEMAEAHSKVVGLALSRA